MASNSQNSSQNSSQGSSSSYAGPNLQAWKPTRWAMDPTGNPRNVQYQKVNTPQGDMLDKIGNQQGQLFGSHGGQQVANGAVSAAQRYGGEAMGYGNTAKGYGGELAGMGRSMYGQFRGNQRYAKQAMNNAFDPQKEFYRQAMGDMMDQTNSQEALRGIANTPYGASISSNAAGRFRNDWQDRQIDRQHTGAQTATTLQNQMLASQLGGGELIDKGGNLNLGAGNIALGAGKLNIDAAQQLLAGYGIDQENMRAALHELTSVFSNLNVSVSSSQNSSQGSSQGSSNSS